VNAVFDALRGRLPAAAADSDQFAGALRDAALAANDAIHKHALRHRELRGMGTTMTAAALRADTLYLAQVGDSRAYLIRDGAAQQITKDQSLMQKLVEAGEITPEQAEQSARRNIILQALGPEASVKVDLTHQPLRRGDVLVLCSDGLSGQVRADEIAELAGRAVDLDVLCRQLIHAANERGGPDNITVVAARFDGDALDTPLVSDAVGHRTYPLDGASDGPTLRIAKAALAELPEPAPAPSSAPPMPVMPGPVILPGRPASAALRDRRERARVYFVALGVAAFVVALITVWQLFFAR
ncbi:MAG: serine/threonine-protein phosphatase, partial [Gemmatirosa sp.]|nr:serine/threonine-protein phosphatase [Gemmatirosa sp.]